MENVAHEPGPGVERNRPMIKHLFKLIWNRKRVNALIMTEIFFSFIVLAVVATTIVYEIDTYSQPVGFSYERVWAVTPDSKLPQTREYRDAEIRGKLLLYQAMRDMPEIESITPTSVTPYSNSTWIHSVDFNGHKYEVEVGRAGDEALKAFNLHMVKGRWFDKSDDADQNPAVVINARLSKALFGDEDPIGKSLDTTRFFKGKVVGVVDEFRKGGEFYTPNYFAFNRLLMTDTARGTFWGFAIKVKDGTTAAFQGKLAATLAATQKGWSFDITPLSKRRDEDFQVHLVPLIAGGLIAGFLLLMVGLGLIGVLWQNVSQRTREIGLRRALGGTSQNVYRQILGELLVIATLGIVAASVVVLQVPLLNLLSFVGAKVYIIGMTLSLLLMYSLTFICGLYPSWLAMEIHPSEALHYE